MAANQNLRMTVADAVEGTRSGPIYLSTNTKKATSDWRPFETSAYTTVLSPHWSKSESHKQR